MKRGSRHIRQVVANLSKLEKDAFWVVLDNRSWMHPFDDQGRRRDYADIPKAVTGLVDDPFRSWPANSGLPVDMLGIHLQRIPLGRFLAPADEAPKCRKGFRCRFGGGLAIGQGNNQITCRAGEAPSPTIDLIAGFYKRRHHVRGRHSAVNRKS